MAIYKFYPFYDMRISIFNNHIHVYVYVFLYRDISIDR